MDSFKKRLLVYFSGFTVFVITISVWTVNSLVTSFENLPHQQVLGLTTSYESSSSADAVVVNNYISDESQNAANQSLAITAPVTGSLVNNKRIIISGTAPANTSLRLEIIPNQLTGDLINQTVGETINVSTVSDKNGRWAYTLPDKLASGEYNVQAFAKDNSGGDIFSNKVNFTSSADSLGGIQLISLVIVTTLLTILAVFFILKWLLLRRRNRVLIGNLLVEEADPLLPKSPKLLENSHVLSTQEDNSDNNVITAEITEDVKDVEEGIATGTISQKEFNQKEKEIDQLIMQEELNSEKEEKDEKI